jgi:hypothetical protein
MQLLAPRQMPLQRAGSGASRNRRQPAGLLRAEPPRQTPQLTPQTDASAVRIPNIRAREAVHAIRTSDNRGRRRCATALARSRRLEMIR